MDPKNLEAVQEFASEEDSTSNTKEEPLIGNGCGQTRVVVLAEEQIGSESSVDNEDSTGITEHLIANGFQENQDGALTADAIGTEHSCQSFEMLERKVMPVSKDKTNKVRDNSGELIFQSILARIRSDREKTNEKQQICKNVPWKYDEQYASRTIRRDARQDLPRSSHKVPRSSHKVASKGSDSEHSGEINGNANQVIITQEYWAKGVHAYEDIEYDCCPQKDWKAIVTKLIHPERQYANREEACRQNKAKEAKKHVKRSRTIQFINSKFHDKEFTNKRREHRGYDRKWANPKKPAEQEEEEVRHTSEESKGEQLLTPIYQEETKK